MSSPIIQIENLNYYYDYKMPTEAHALKDINITVGQGEYVVFFGPSGCGKTTLIYLIGGIETEQNGTGRIMVNNRDVRRLSKDELAVFRQTGIGIIFQQFNLIPSLNVLDNVALPMAFVGIPVKERREKAHKILERLAMDKYAFRFPSELSGGQQQRVGIARALANNPPIIIADEPLGNLDSENAELVLAFLKELHDKDERTVIMVTHEAWSVRDADKIIYLKDGAVTKMGESTAKKPEVELSPISPKLFRELYPDLTPTEIMIKSLSNLLLRGFSSDEIKRFEFFLGQRIDNKIDADTFLSFLDRPFHDEGVGLWKQRAIKIASLTEDLIKQKRELTDVYNELEKNPEKPISEEVASLREWVLSEYKGKMDENQIIRLDEAITKRLRGIITPEDFRKVLNLAKSKFGVGFSLRTMQHVSDRLESALSLGHMGGVAEAVNTANNVSG